jgi:hypothetical protein
MLLQVSELLSGDLIPNLQPAMCESPDVTRDSLCYNEEVDAVLRRHEAALRVIYARTCVINGVTTAGGLANKLVSYPNWKEFLRLFGLVDTDLTDRDAVLCFVWSRMRTIDEQESRSRIKWMHLAFEECDAQRTHARAGCGSHERRHAPSAAVKAAAHVC